MTHPSQAATERSPRPPANGFRTYSIIWGGQFVSLAGTGLANFALVVYIYRDAGAVTILGLAYALSFIPWVMLSPLAGPLVDRWGAKRALIVSNAGAVPVVGTMALLLFTGHLQIWHIYCIIAATSALKSLQMPAFETTVPLLVAKRNMGRANGMRLAASAAAEVLAPLCAGLLLLAVDLKGIILIDSLSYGVALVTLLFVTIPRPRGIRTNIGLDPGTPTGGGVTQLLRDFREAWRYVNARPGLKILMYFLGAMTFVSGFVDVLHTPLVLAFTNPASLGLVLTVGGIGYMSASLGMTARGGPRRRVRAILIFSFVAAAAIVVGSLRPNVPLIAVSAFVFLAACALIAGNTGTLWQTKVETAMLGRAVALRHMVLLTPQLLGYALAGPLADYVFQPLIGRDDVRSSTVATVVGHGPGRGIAVMILLTGVLMAAAAAVACFSPRLRNLEEEVPDAVADPDEVTPELPEPAVSVHEV
jgi:MFS family permease